MATGKTTFQSTVILCTTMLLLVPLFFFTRAESYGLPHLNSPRLGADFRSGEMLFGRSINAIASEEFAGLWRFSYLLIGLGCVYFPVQWLSNYLDESDYFGSNFH